MASVGQVLGRTLLIQIGDGGSPTEVFTNLCGLKTRSFNLSAGEVDTTIPDCANPGNVVQKTSRPGIANRTFTGSGAYVAGANMSAFMTHVINATAFNAKVIVPGLGTFSGSWFVTDFTASGDVEPNMEFNATFTAGDTLTFTPEA
ncbi:phage tail tube protein [Rhizobium leguminosarum]|uniref:Putative secreted protein n=1 Tax=Rhizobium leguminosarum TaxID=384 RepID=A0A7W9ZXG1_RHILE|nr:phage tail tube protein [Rhizobium leguminosarum]MBB6224567.1 putative secreted protein [Rhizobium leguminosarum]